MSFDLYTQIFLAGLSDPISPGGGYVPPGINTNDGGWLDFPAALPDAQHFMALANYVQPIDDRGAIIGFEDVAASDGFFADNANSDGFSRPVFKVPLDGVTDINWNSADNYPLNQRMLWVVTGSMTGGTALSYSPFVGQDLA